jgi:single-strand DNA-binding protein
MAMLNQCSFIGRLGKDPDIQVTSNGKPYTRFSLAVSDGKDTQGKEKTLWLGVVTWDKLAETVERYATKGMQAYVQGKLQVQDYTDKDGVKRQSMQIVAFTVQLLERSKTGNGNGGASSESERDPFLPDFPDE